MDFRTPVSIDPVGFRLGLQSRVLTAGSCFAEVMGGRLQANKLNVLSNPFGTVFNPVSLAHLLHTALHNGGLPENRLVGTDGQWFHYDLHSRFAAGTREALLTEISRAMGGVSAFLPQTDCLILTLGTAWVYRLRTDGSVVANCHKVPASEFEKTLLTAGQVSAPLAILFRELLAKQPGLRIILTVSPVRHLKDTLPMNSLSKSVLRVACHELAEMFASVSYFPAYEIMTDDLRDYRFYKADMIHPSETAEQYIWQLFTESHMDAAARRFLNEWADIRRALAHRPLQPQSAGHRRFLQGLEQRLASFQYETDVSQELALVRGQLSH